MRTRSRFPSKQRLSLFFFLSLLSPKEGGGLGLSGILYRATHFQRENGPNRIPPTISLHTMPGSHGDFSPPNGENGNSMSLTASIFHHSLLQQHSQTCEFFLLLRGQARLLLRNGAPCSDRRTTDDAKRGGREKKSLLRRFLSTRRKNDGEGGREETLLCTQPPTLLHNRLLSILSDAHPHFSCRPKNSPLVAAKKSTCARPGCPFKNLQTPQNSSPQQLLIFSSLTFSILISLPSRFWDFARFFLVMALMATTSRGLCKKRE